MMFLLHHHGDHNTGKIFSNYKATFGSDGKASVYNAGDLGSIPGPARFPGEGNDNPLRTLA